MKIAITGHSKGIGKALFNHCIYKGHTCIGYSRSNGFDINEQYNIIARESKQCDVFVNNAFDYGGQINMFKSMYNAWKDDSTKTIVNVGSRTKYYPVGGTRSPDYTREKRALNDEVNSAILYSNKKCRIININPGYVETDMTKDRDVPKLSALKIAETILWCLDQPQTVEIGEISIWVT